LEMLEEDGQIDMHCDYCGNHYIFDAMDMVSLSSGNAGTSESSVH